jgi:hypothetical protein
MTPMCLQHEAPSGSERRGGQVEGRCICRLHRECKSQGCSDARGPSLNYKLGDDEAAHNNRQKPACD